MASHFYRNDSDGDSDYGFDDDDDIFDGHDFQPVTEEMLTLEVQYNLDDIFTGNDNVS